MSTKGGREMEKLTLKPRQPARRASAPRVLAQTRSRTECQSPTVKGKRRCRMHGGTNPGAPKGNRNARKHGGSSATALAAARYLREIVRQRPEEHTSALQSLMRISYAVLCLNKHIYNYHIQQK